MRVAGKTHCHPQARPAFGYLRRSAGQLDPARAVPEVAVVLPAHALEVGVQVCLHRGRQHRRAVLVPLAVADGELVRREVHILHTQATAFQQPQPCAIQQDRHEPRDARKVLEDGADLLARQDHGQMQGPLGALTTSSNQGRSMPSTSR